MKEQVQLLKIVFDFLDDLSEEQLEMLVNNKAKLNLVVEKVEVNKTNISEIYVDDICENMEHFTTREEALEYITSLSLLKNQLKAMAKKYGVPIGSKETNSQIIDKIIENVVGSKLKFDALLNTDLKG